jgi:hypothetical protein
MSVIGMAVAVESAGWSLPHGSSADEAPVADASQQIGLCVTLAHDDLGFLLRPPRMGVLLSDEPFKGCPDQMDSFLAFVEGSDLSQWIRGDSMLAFPTIITLHTICMGLLAGASSAIDRASWAWRPVFRSIRCGPSIR